jgi:hypothetical protein
VGIQRTNNFFPLIQVSQLKSVPLREVAVFLFPLIEVNVNTGLEEEEYAILSYKFPLTEVHRRLRTQEKGNLPHLQRLRTKYLEKVIPTYPGFPLIQV